MDISYSPPLVRQSTLLRSSALKPRQRQLMTLAKAGDADAFAILYDDYVDRVYGYMYFNLANAQTAEDLTARVFSKAWNNLQWYEPDQTPFSVWLYHIAREAVLQFNGDRSDSGTIKEILAPADEGLPSIGPARSSDDSPPTPIQ